LCRIYLSIFDLIDLMEAAVGFRLIAFISGHLISDSGGGRAAPRHWPIATVKGR